MGQITSLEFSPHQFPLSPNMETYAIGHEFNKVVLVGIGKAENFDNYTTSFSDQEAGTLAGVPDGPYKAVVTALNPDRHPIIILTFINCDTSQTEETLTLDYPQFIAAFEVAQDSLTQNDMNNDAEYEAQHEFETGWSINYLQSLWSGKLSGPYTFWKTLYEDLDITCMPLMFKAGLAELPLAQRPAFEVRREETPKYQ